MRKIKISRKNSTVYTAYCGICGRDTAHEGVHCTRCGV